MRPSCVETHPERSKLFVDQELARTLSASSNKRSEFTCEQGHVWDAVVRNVIASGHGCPFCRGQRVLTGFNDVATTHPERVSLFVDPELPLTVSAGSHRRAAFKCEGGHEWQARVLEVVAKGTSCPTCYANMGARRVA